MRGLRGEMGRAGGRRAVGRLAGDEPVDEAQGQEQQHRQADGFVDVQDLAPRRGAGHLPGGVDAEDQSHQDQGRHQPVEAALGAVVGVGIAGPGHGRL